MSIFQIVALVLLGLLCLGSLTATWRGYVSRRAGWPWVVVWLAAATAIIWPGTTRVVAKALGIGRGADLVLYCFVLIVLVGFYMTYVRLRRLDANLTMLVRHLALQNATAPQRDSANEGLLARP
ncbi:MAG: DUF2304 domain-containing protein [Planctomycetota bacterium]